MEDKFLLMQELKKTIKKESKEDEEGGNRDYLKMEEQVKEMKKEIESLKNQIGRIQNNVEDIPKKPIFFDSPNVEETKSCSISEHLNNFNELKDTIAEIYKLLKDDPNTGKKSSAHFHRDRYPNILPAKESRHIPSFYNEKGQSIKGPNINDYANFTSHLIDVDPYVTRPNLHNENDAVREKEVIIKEPKSKTGSVSPAEGFKKISFSLPFMKKKN